MYAKAHPIGYISRGTNKTKKNQCFNRQCRRVQTIIMADGSVKQIYHTEPSYKKGRSLGEKVYESFKF